MGGNQVNCRPSQDNREGRSKRISPIRFEPSTSDRRNTGDLLDDRVEDCGPPGEMSRPSGGGSGGAGGGGGGAGGGGRSTGPVDFTNKLKVTEQYPLVLRSGSVGAYVATCRRRCISVECLCPSVNPSVSRSVRLRFA